MPKSRYSSHSVGRVVYITFLIGLAFFLVSKASANSGFSFINGPAAFFVDTWKELTSAATIQDEAALVVPFMSGNLVVLQIGDGTGTGSSTAEPVFLREYTPSGSLVQTIAVPSTGPSRRLTASGFFNADGQLVRSADGHYLTFAGYDAIAGSSSLMVPGTARVFGRVNNAGAVDLNTALTDGGTGDTTSVASTNGLDLWMTNSGLRYQPYGNNGPATVVSGTLTNTRVVKVFNSQLYMTSGSSAFTCVSSIGSGTPTGTGNVPSRLPGMTCSNRSPQSFSIDPSGNTMFVADDGFTNAGIQKWVRSSGMWSNPYTFAPANGALVRGLTVDWSGANPVVYATMATSFGELVTVTDTGPGSTITTLATALANTYFRGIDFAPDAGTPVPSTTPTPTFTPTPATTQTFVVTKTADTNDGVCNADCSLREALAAANANSTDDIINFDPAVFNSSQTIILNGTQLTVVNNGTLTINGPGSNLLIVSGNDVSRVFSVSANSTSTISGLKIYRGRSSNGDGSGIYNTGTLTLNNCVVANNAAGPKGTDNGGGIYNDGQNAMLTLNSTAVTNNSGNGGGIFNLNGTLFINNSAIDSNIGVNGAGIFNSSGTLTLSGSTVNNNAAGMGGGLGGGINNYGGVVGAYNSAINGNSSANDGGAIYNSNGVLDFANTTINGNTTTGGTAGGAIRSFQGRGTMTDVKIQNNTACTNCAGGGFYQGGDQAYFTLNNVTISGNTAAGAGGIVTGYNTHLSVTNSSITNNTATGSGGGMSVGDGTVSLTNTTISNNKTLSSFGQGGGIQVGSAVLNLTNCTVVNNQTGSSGGGGIHNGSGTAVGTINMLNTIVADNTAVNSTAQDLYGDFVSQGHNLVENVSSANILGITIGNILGQDPQLISLRNNGGTTDTVALQPWSPAIDAGDPNSFPVTDQRGVARPQDGDLDGSSLPDIGAYERQLTQFVVTKTSDTNDGTCDADCSLREAIAAAGLLTSPDSVIVFDPNVFSSSQTIALTLGELTLGSSGRTIFLKGTGSSQLAISGGGLSRAILIPEGVYTKIASVTIRGGMTGGSGGGLNNFGAVYLTDAAVMSNTAANGGGIFSSGTSSSLTIRNSTITDNTATSLSGGGLDVSGNVSMSNSSLTNNTSSVGNGGALYNSGSTTILDSVISNNSSAVGGGGVGNNAGSISISRSTLSNNSAINGGALYTSGSGGTVSLTASTLSGNTAGTLSGPGKGGAIDNESLAGTLNLTNVTVAGNHSTGKGGGINNTGAANLTNSTVAKNIADDLGGGIVTPSGTVNSRNSIIGDNQAANGSPDFSGSLTSQGWNLIENTEGTAITGTTIGNILGQDPGLGLLANHGGPTQTLALLTGSTAIDKGSAASNVFTDQRGLSRPYDFPSIPNANDGNGSDIGAFERQASDDPTPTPTATPPLYPDTTVILSRDATVVPSAIPSNSTSVSVSSNTNFFGTLTADPQTGVVRVTNASPVGVFPVTVMFFGQSGTSTATFVLTVAGGGSCSQTSYFTSAPNVSADSATRIIVGDFNGDGIQDLLANTYIRLGDGVGGFSGSTSVSVNNSSTSSTVGDFNGDGKQDLAITTVASSPGNEGAVAIRLGDGLGGFSGTTSIGVGLSPSSIALGDFNGDGKQDFATANSGSNTVSIRLGDGQRGFSGTTEISVGSYPVSIAVGDFNGDGKEDLAVSNLSQSTVSVRLGDGLGVFGGTTEVGVGSQPISLAIGDFNNDGKQDLAVANNLGSGTVAIRLGNGAGSFPGISTISVGAFPGNLAVGDFNNDGNQDIIIANRSSLSTSVRMGNGLGGFAALPDVSINDGQYGVAVGDFNTDGVQDFAVARTSFTGGIAVRLGGCGASPTPTNTSTPTPSATRTATATPTSTPVPTVACPIVLPNDGASSTNARAPSTRYANSRAVYLIMPSELAAAGLQSGISLTSIGWDYQTAPGISGSAPLKIYLQNTGNTSYSKGTTFSSAINGMTLVHNATTMLPAAVGPFDITFSGGSSFTYTGSGLYVAYDWGTYAGPLASSVVTWCNASGLTNSLAGGNTNSDSLSISNFRPETRLSRICPTPTASPTPTNTPTYTPTPAPTPTATLTNTPTPTPTGSPCGTPGNLDPSFNGNGKVTTSIGSINDNGQAVAVQTDGKIVVAGYSKTGSNYDFAVVRYNADGMLDSTFNGSGYVTTPVGSLGDYAFAVAVQPDGKIVTAGYIESGTSSTAALVRYNANGTLDTSFNGTGKVITPIASGAELKSIAIQSDGKIVVAGYAYVGVTFDFAVVRYNANGTLDTSFNGTGKVTTPVGSQHDFAGSVAIQSDGKIVLAGNSFIAGSSYEFALVRYNVNGTLDTSFNGTGKVTTSIGTRADDASSVAIQPDGKIVAAGDSDNGVNYDFAVVRYNANGTLDTSFNGTGKITTPIGGSDDGASSVAIQTDGRILAAGSSNNDSNNDFALVRYNTNGTLDTSFNGTGKVTTPIGNGEDAAYSLAIQSDGKIVAVGTINNGVNLFAAVRYYGLACPTSTTTPTNTATPTDTPTAAPTPSPALSGTLTYGNAIGAPTPRYVSNVTVTGAGSPNVMTTTAPPGPTAGQYTLTGFGVGSYTVTPSKNGGINGSITSFDAAKIAQHVAGISVLTGNQFIVADVSGNGTLSSFDAGELARYVAALTGFGSTGNWIFSPVIRNYLGVSTTIMGQDYTALLMGEVSGNWNNTGARSANGPERASAIGAPYLVTPVDNEVIIPVWVQGAANKGIISYEFDLRYDPAVIRPLVDPVDLTGTVSRGLTAVANAEEPGLLRVVLYGAFPIDGDGVLLNLGFRPVGAPGSVSPLIFERIMFNEGAPSVVASDGHVELSSPAMD